MKEDTNENDNLYIDNVDENAGIDKVLISTSSSLEDEDYLWLCNNDSQNK